MLRFDGKQPDDISLVPWKCGQTLVWDVTCPHTNAPSHLALTGVEAGSVATEATREQNIKSWICAPFCASGHRDIRILWPCSCSLFLLIWENRSQTSWRNPEHTSFCFSMWLSKFSGVLRHLYWELCLRLFAFF